MHQNESQDVPRKMQNGIFTFKAEMKSELYRKKVFIPGDVSRKISPTKMEGLA